MAHVSRSAEPLEYREAVIRGTTVGLAVGVVFAFVTALAAFAMGMDSFTARFGPLGSVTVVHLVGSSAAGFIAGLLHRLVHSRLQAGLVGSVSMLPYSALAVYVQAGARGRHWGMLEVVITLVTAGLFGGFTGQQTWVEFTKPESGEAE